MLSSTFWKAFWGAMFGKFVIGVFLAVCAILGFGPEAWTARMITDLPQWVTPERAQWGFLVLGAATFLFGFKPWNWFSKSPISAEAKIAQGVPQEIINIVQNKTIKAERDVGMLEALAFLQSGHWGLSPNNLLEAKQSERMPIGQCVKAVQQAALDGHIRVWGRTSGRSPQIPIVPIDWAIMQINILKIFYDVSETEPSEIGGHTPKKYHDLMVSKLEIENRWPPNSVADTKTSDRRRVPIKEFIDEAGKVGWSLETTEILDLERGVQQAARDGDLVLWGRPNVHRLPKLNKYEPLDKIPDGHWKDYKAQLLDAMNVADNLESQTYSTRFSGQGDPNKFTDLHIEWNVAKTWLIGDGLQYRGWNKKQEDERNARR